MLKFLTKETVIKIHDKVISISCGRQGLRDNGLLESALANPQNLYYYQDADVFLVCRILLRINN